MRVLPLLICLAFPATSQDELRAIGVLLTKGRNGGEKRGHCMLSLCMLSLHVVAACCRCMLSGRRNVAETSTSKSLAGPRLFLNVAIGHDHRLKCFEHRK
jgi:hypothetical protein